MADTKTKKPPSKLKTCLKAIYIVVMAFYGLYGLYLATQVYFKFRDLSKGFNNIVENWGEDIITDFSFVANGAQCPVGYTAEFEYNYGGARAGCDCSSSTGSNNIDKKFYTSPKTCNSTQISAGCLESKEWAAKTLTLLSTLTDSTNA